MKGIITFFALLALILMGGCADPAQIDNTELSPSPFEDVQTEPTPGQTAEPSSIQPTSAIKLLVKSISFDPAKNVYIISGQTAQNIGEYPSGAPKLELGEIKNVELSPDEIVKCDNYETTTIKKLYEEYYLSEGNQFFHYPMVFDVDNKSFGNYGN